MCGPVVRARLTVIARLCVVHHGMLPPPKAVHGHMDSDAPSGRGFGRVGAVVPVGRAVGAPWVWSPWVTPPSTEGPKGYQVAVRAFVSGVGGSGGLDGPPLGLPTWRSPDAPRLAGP